MIPFAAAAIALALIAYWSTRSARRIERETFARLRVGPDGIVPGAAPLELPGADARHAVLLLHGFGDTPQALDYLARELRARGYGVMVPLLPGHGRTLRDFAASDAAHWLGAAHSALAMLRGRYERVSVVGLSMGGALAAQLAADDAELPALVLLAPYLDAPPLLRALARCHVVWRTVAPVVPSGNAARSIHDPEARARSLAYGATTPRLLAELVRVADGARARLPRVIAPTLLVQSREDNRVTPAVAERALRALGAAEKRLEWLHGCGHVVTVDRCRTQVAALVGDWLDRHRA